ncbi:hypothetical protein LTR86_010999 [Recurvomyces mirabilis]|nr:hypothetical protein LTR86_010999 [Recurvomyces mirabilis]
MDSDGLYPCPQSDCRIRFTDKKNISRHLCTVHGKQARPRGRPKKVSRHWAESGDLSGQIRTEVHDRQDSQLVPNLPHWSAVRLSDNWWSQQLWYRQICSQRYYWNRNGLLEKLLHLRRLDSPKSSSEGGFVRLLDPRDLPVKSEADALRAVRHHRLKLKYYSKGQFEDAKKKPDEFYDTLLLNLSALPRPADPRYAKVAIDEHEFDYSSAPIDQDFLHNLQQPEIFASPAGSWSDVHIGILYDLANDGKRAPFAADT